MHRGIFFLIIGVKLLTILAGSTLWASEAPGDVTCAIWNSASDGERLMYAVGYSVGATYAAATAGSQLSKKELVREVLMYLLPENYRFGAIVSEVDISCSLAVAGNKSIMTVLEDMAREKNAALIYQRENQPYEQFFKK
jgi:predicted alpha/beta-fold hydrolase